ncbi:uncharacterized protein CDV56_102807 [Aspergillus thermomutatus]|uniref:Amidase domain-containing protein n=1 Tax=Aspergillus thermomutatus TaxID=41047 RepID=A0A397G230_ASPTH|nr:uncharacterized protein CDV56_102807 [Aspergillus thermomutatus]RHZ45092.1 hypothetical protein CDV56_102807 [Aspergillus thermomutatus]
MNLPSINKQCFVASETLNLVNASIRDLKRVLDASVITSVQLVTIYLQRIAKYDCNGPSLNQIPVPNPKIFEEAQASDNYRASVEGLTVAAGSPPFADLNFSCDATIVSSLRKAGAIVLGKTNMPAMAGGGGQRGLYGRSKSPYNPKYSTTAYASRSSNSAGTPTTASFTAFGFAGETVSSGRSPASNNALVRYSPSRGVIPFQGQWPLYLTCDVIVPHAQTVKELLDILNVIMTDNPNPIGDFWRGQSVCPIPLSSQVWPVDCQSLEDPHSLKGKQITIPMRYIRKQFPTAVNALNAFTSSVHDLWLKAQTTLESLGATVIPWPEHRHSLNAHSMDEHRTMPDDHYWMGRFPPPNGDTSYPNLTVADADMIHPHIAPMDDPTMHTEVENHVRYMDMIEAGRYQGPREMWKRDLEDWMDSNSFNLVVFPTNGDVARADSEEL